MWYQLIQGRPGSQGKWMYYIEGTSWCFVCYDDGPVTWLAFHSLGGIDPIALDATDSGLAEVFSKYYTACSEWQERVHHTSHLSVAANDMVSSLSDWLTFNPG